MRDRTVMMARIRNEERWIGRNLERTWQVCSKVVLWDDGSDDGTFDIALESLGPNAPETAVHELIAGGGGSIIRGKGRWGPYELHFLRSPYTNVVRPKERRNELRDKNSLWSYVKGAVDFDYVLCLDGDEVLSQKALEAFGEMWIWLSSGTCDWITLPFIYLWDKEDQRRIDGIYGDQREDTSPTLRFPRFFSIKRLDEQQLYDTKFDWQGTRGGLHCGSVPQSGFLQIKPKILHARYAYVLHYGYLDEAMRQGKFTLYNEIDPGNTFEGEYRHVIGLPNVHAPGPVQLVPWSEQ